ncbi:MAG TPA: hypothetical protein VMY88_05725 [Acidimicrobiales bacterium]|nr:hypothetical protein [Acidimicrobiales bacterium]
MKPFYAALALLTALFVGACGAEGEPSAGASATSKTTSLPDGVDEMLQNRTSGGVELVSTGLVAVQEEKTKTEVPFGTPVSDVTAILQSIIGEPDSGATQRDCSSGGATSQTSWPGLLLLSVGEKFVGWEATDQKYTVVGKQTELTIGTPLSEVEKDLGPLGLTETPRGVEFVLRDGEAIQFAGAFETNEPTAPLVAFSAGVNCYIR